MNNEIKELLEERFKEQFPKKRLLAIHLNGFSHSVFMDSGDADDEVEAESISFYAPEQTPAKGLPELFQGFGHGTYQGNAKEYVWVLPSER